MQLVWCRITSGRRPKFFRVGGLTGPPALAVQVPRTCTQMEHAGFEPASWLFPMGVKANRNQNVPLVEKSPA